MTDDRLMTDDRAIAYFSMEIGIRDEMPTYSGGLGMLAGDTIRSAADLQVPMVAVTLLHRRGYFYQRLDDDGWQSEEPVNWVVKDYLTDTELQTEVEIEGRTVRIRIWRYDVTSAVGSTVPVYFLDTDLAENETWDRTLTDHLYGGDNRYRLCQEVVLGMGGVRALRALGYAQLRRFHMNEGHAALLTLELLREEREKAQREKVAQADLESVHSRCVFTTHTPVPAGHDQFPMELAEQVLGSREACDLFGPVCDDHKLNMTFLALSLSGYINGVAKRHGEIARHMFAGYKIEAITNGVHAATWTSPSFAALFDQYVPGWKQDSFSLRSALSIPDDEVWRAHQVAKRRLCEFANHATNAGLDSEVLTIGFARRAATYKRGDLIFDDPVWLRRISQSVGRLQLVFGGKAHPHDQEGKRLIQRVIQQGRAMQPDLKVVFLPNYEMGLARLMTAGVDLWLNTPEPPQEASGTSGMKAALNGVPSLSILDGWWIEGCMENLTGWAIGRPEQGVDRARDARALYTKLEETIVPMYYNDRLRFIEVMRHAIALNGSFFNTHRMVQQYVLEAYFR